MRSDSFLLDTPDGTPVFVRTWHPEATPRGAVLVAHGMAEHSARYERLAQALTDAGYVVYAPDHSGHGETVGGPDDVGYFSDDDGFDTVVNDLHLLVERISADNPGLPVVMLGHSMGSFLARSYAIAHSGDITALVLSGTGGSPGVLGAIGRVIATTEARVRGRRHTSGLMNTLTFGQYNAKFKPARTDFDWLSRDPDEVDKYVADPQCGRVHTSGFFADLLGGLIQVNDSDQVARVRPDLPVLLVSGEDDPVGDGGKGVRAVAEQLQEAGVSDVSVRLYPGARHELFNETNRDEVTADVLAWIDLQVDAVTSNGAS